MKYCHLQQYGWYQDCYIERSQSDRERETVYDISYMQNLKRNDTNETEKDSQT